MERELDLLGDVRVMVALGGFGFGQLLRILGDRGFPVPTPRPRFGHGVHVDLGSVQVLASYHPSQQNTFTGRLTEPMLDAVFERAVTLAGL